MSDPNTQNQNNPKGILRNKHDPAPLVPHPAEHQAPPPREPVGHSQSAGDFQHKLISEQLGGNDAGMLRSLSADETAYRMPPSPQLQCASPIVNMSEQSAPRGTLNPHGIIGPTSGYPSVPVTGQSPNELSSLFQWSWRPPSEACSQYSVWSAARSGAATSVTSGVAGFEHPDQCIRYVKPKNGGDLCIIKGKDCALVVGMKRKISPIAFPLVEVVLKADNAKDDEYELVLRPADKGGGYKSGGREIVVWVCKEAFANQTIPDGGRDYDVTIRIQGRILHGQIPVTVMNENP